MVTAEVAQRRAADRWFLERGLPAVLRPGALVRRLWPRSAPALAAFAVFMLNSILVVLFTGKHTIDIDGKPTRTEWFVLGLLVLVLPVAATVGWRVSRIRSVRVRTLVASVSMGVVVAGGILGGPSERILANLVFEGIVIVVGLALTACGVGLHPWLGLCGPRWRTSRPSVRCSCARYPSCCSPCWCSSTPTSG